MKQAIAFLGAYFVLIWVLGTSILGTGFLAAIIWRAI